MKVLNENPETDQLFRTLTDALRAGQQQPRSYNGENKLSIPYTARFKMKIWYRDGNSRTYYSYDQIRTSAGNITDEYEGLKKLVRLGHVHHKQEVKTLVIWANVEPTPLTSSNGYDYEILKITYKGELTRPGVSFRNNAAEKSTILKYDQIKIQNKKIG